MHDFNRTIELPKMIQWDQLFQCAMIGSTPITLGFLDTGDCCRPARVQSWT
jgi:hypothetical protein